MIFSKIFNIISHFTKPEIFFQHKLYGTYWIPASMEKWNEYDNPLEIYVYQEVCQDWIGVWKELDNFVVLEDDCYLYAVENLITMN